MTITNGYCELTEVTHADVLNFSTTAHETIVEAIIEGVSRNIDNYCGRRFYAASETRYYTASHGWLLDVDDVSDVAASASFALYTDDDGDGTYENTWAATDYHARPYNASQNGFPYTSFETTPAGNYHFPYTRKGVKIVAPFGFLAVPKPVNRACVLQSARLFKRYTAVLGVAGASQVGIINMTIPALDPDVVMLLRPYVRYL